MASLGSRSSRKRKAAWRHCSGECPAAFHASSIVRLTVTAWRVWPCASWTVTANSSGGPSDSFSILIRASTSASPPCLLVLHVTSGSGARAVLHVIDKGPQFRHHVMAAGIVEKYTRRRWREGLEDVD